MSPERAMTTSPLTRITEELLTRWPLPEPGGDKESRGRTLVVGGTSDTPGAVLLAGEAVLRVGAGKLQIATAQPVAAALAVAVPEAQVTPLPVDDRGNLDVSGAEQVLALAEGADAVLVGPGFSDPDAATGLLDRIIPALDRPLVIDAVGSAYVTAHEDGVQHLSGRAVLTLNPDELAHTLQIEESRVSNDPARCTRELAERTHAVVLYGGEEKVVAAPDGSAWTTSAGGPGLGVSGSGDVQAGIVTGLLARGAEPEQAACWGGHLHGLAGDQLAEQWGRVGYLAREIAPCLPALLERLHRASRRSG